MFTIGCPVPFRTNLYPRPYGGHKSSVGGCSQYERVGRAHFRCALRGGLVQTRAQRLGLVSEEGYRAAQAGDYRGAANFNQFATVQGPRRPGRILPGLSAALRAEGVAHQASARVGAEGISAKSNSTPIACASLYTASAAQLGKYPAAFQLETALGFTPSLSAALTART